MTCRLCPRPSQAWQFQRPLAARFLWRAVRNHATRALRAATSFREGGQLDMPRPSTHALRVEAQAALDSVPSAVTK